MTNAHLPPDAEHVEVDGVGGWLYEIQGARPTPFTFFLFQKADGWHVMLASPGLDELAPPHDQHVLPSGEITLFSVPATEGEAYAQSTAWVADPAAARSIDSRPESPTATAQRARPAPTVTVIPDADLLTGRVKQDILGQDEAVDLLCRTVSEHIAKVAPQHPLVLVAVGPTGTGKSGSIQALVSALRELYSEAGYEMVRINLSQYKEEYRISELFGSPPGYVGYKTQTNLVAAMTASPKQIVLWDELEKAHPRVITALLSLLDTGSLTLPAPLADGTYELDCRQSIHVFSTNLQWRAIYDALLPMNGFGDADKINAICARAFVEAGEMSELVGRFRQFLFFQPLDEPALRAIADQAIHKLAGEYGLTVLSCDPAIVSLVLQQDREASLGARPIQAIANRLLAPSFVAAIRQGSDGQVSIRLQADRILI